MLPRDTPPPSYYDPPEPRYFTCASCRHEYAMRLHEGMCVRCNGDICGVCLTENVCERCLSHDEE